MADDFSADIHTTGTIVVGGTATGEVEIRRDQDWFAVELVAGRTYTIDVEGAGYGGGTLTHTVLRGVYDADGTIIRGARDKNNDATPGHSGITFTATETGTHYINARGKGKETGTYTVRVEDVTPAPDDDFAQAVAGAGAVTIGGTTSAAIETAGDRDWFAIEAVAGTSYRISVKGADSEDGTLADPHLHGIYSGDGGDAGTARLEWTEDSERGKGRNAELTWTAPTTATYYIAAGADADETGTYTVEVEALTDDFHGSEGGAGTIEAGGTATGEIHFEGDRDWFTVTVEPDTWYQVDVEGTETDAGTLADPYLRAIRDANGNYVNGSDDDGGEGQNARAIFHSGAGGTFRIEVGGDEGYWPWVDDRPWQGGTYTVGVKVLDDDFGAGTESAGTVTVGTQASGTFEAWEDVDWFAVTLEAGVTYVIDLKPGTGPGWIAQDTEILGVHDATGRLIPGTGNDDGGRDDNARAVFTATEDATYYIAATGRGHAWPLGGHYVLDVTRAGTGDDYASDAGTTGTVAVGGTATGEIDFGGDRDWFSVTLEAGKHYQVDLEGTDTDQGTLRNPVIYGVYDASGDAVAGSDDDNDGRLLNARSTFIAPEDGTYYISAGAYESPGATGGTYRVRVREIEDDAGTDTTTAGRVEVGGTAQGRADFEGDEDWFAVDLVEGHEYRIEVRGTVTDDGTLRDPYLHGIQRPDGSYIGGTRDDDSGESLNAETTFVARETATYYISAGRDSHYSASNGTYTVAVTDLGAHADDRGTTAAEAGTLLIGGSATGTVDYAGDRDWFAASLEAGMTYRIDIEGAPNGHGTLGYAELHGIYDANGALIPNTEDEAGGYSTDARFFFVAPEKGIYYLDVGGYDGEYPWAEGTYRVSLTEIADDAGADTATQRTIAVGETVTGAIDYDGDRDWLAVVLSADATYRIDVKGAEATDSGGTLENPVLTVYDADGNVIPIATDDDSGVGANARLAAFSPETDGTYFIEASAARPWAWNAPDQVGTYTVVVAETTDA